MAWSRRDARFRRARLSQRPSTLKTCSRSGFTLVEMLVAVTLVLLMMVMFGEIFQVASGSVTKQRTLSDNDQNARTFVTVFRADLDKRSFRSVVPFFPGEQSSNPGTPFELREGYFYISCNNPNDGTDDVLQFSVLSTVHTKSADENLYFGKARTLPTPGSTFLGIPNQPDRDDGQVTVNSAGASRAGEVCYWMRGGNLYRRVMLLRDPIPAPGVDSNTPSQPSYFSAGPASNIDYFLPGGVYSLLTGPNPNFWGDFDYSAHAQPASATPNTFKAVFNGLEYLANDTAPLPLTPWAPSLGQTWNRFGFHHYGFPAYPVAGGTLTYGVPREFAAPLPASPTAAPDFIGRFTHEETSNPAFIYPHSPGSPAVAVSNWMDASVAGPAVALNADGVVVGLENGSRAGTDLLLTNVHGFRVEVWDQRLNNFAPVGHSSVAIGLNGVATPGDFHVARRLNSTYGPLASASPPTFGPSIFDTWHPNFDRNVNGFLGDAADRPPFRPVTWDPTGISGEVPPGPTPSAPAMSPFATCQKGFWAPRGAFPAAALPIYNVGDVVFPRMEAVNGNGLPDAGEDGLNGFPANGILDRRLTEDVNGNNVLDASEEPTYGFPADGQINSTDPPFFPFGLTYAYRCVQAGTPGSLSSEEPFRGRWNTIPGKIISGNPADIDLNSDGDMLDPGEVDFNKNGIVDPAEPSWIVDYNVRPLKAIRVTIRFQHPQSKQMRQVSIVHSLRDTTYNVFSAPNTTSGP